MRDEYTSPKEGELYTSVKVEGYTFDIKYGYYEESDRKHCEPVAVYPDLIKNPHYTKQGRPIVTAIQSPCKNYKSRTEEENCCSDCIHYLNEREEISVCTCEERRKKENPPNPKTTRRQKL